MESITNKFNDDNYHLYQKIPNSISSKELYAEKDLGVNIKIKKIKIRQQSQQYNMTKEY